MKKLLRYILILGLFTAILITVAYFLAKKYEPEVREIVTYELNRNLAVPVSVEDINLSLLQRFPYASLRFSNVVVPQVIDGKQQPDTLIYVKDLYFQIGLLDFFMKDYTITEAEINTGFFDMALYANGKDNFHFWKSSDDSSGAATLSLKEILIRNFRYGLKTADKLEMDFLVEKAKSKGDFGSERYDISTDSEILMEQVVQSGDTMYLNERLSGDITLNIDQISGQYSFLSSNLELADTEFELNGKYVPDGKSLQWDIEIATENADLNQLLHVLPLSSKRRFAAYGAKGKTDLRVKIMSGQQFDLDASFDNLRGAFQNNKELGTAKIENAKGKLEMRGSISSLFLDELSASIGPGDIKAWGKIIDFNAPSFDLNLEGELDLEELKSLLSIDLVAQLEGRVEMNGRLQGRLPRDAQNETLELLKGIDFVGKILLNDGVFQMAGQSQIFDKIRGEVALKDNAVIIKSAEARVNESPFSISGNIENALPYLSRKGQKLSINARFAAESLNFNEILSSTETSRDTTYNFSLPADVAFDLGVDIGEITFRKFEAKNISGKAYYKGGLLTLNPLHFETASGDVKSKMSVKTLSARNFAAEALAEMKNIDLNELFEEFENFGQAVIQSKNVEGKANASLTFSGTFDRKLALNSKSIKSKIDLLVNDGKLNRVEAFQDIADYLRGNAVWRTLIKVDDFEKKLKEVRFGKLENQIVIENEVVNIPNMTISSSALTMNISGSHTFDNVIDYSLDFKLSEILKTGKQESSEFGYIVEDGSGMRLYMRMSGTVDNPEFSLDKGAARDSRKQKLEQEKNNFKGILKEEFGLFKSDSTIKAPPKAEKRDPRFSVEWDGTSKKDSTKKNQRKKVRDEDLFGEDDDL